MEDTSDMSYLNKIDTQTLIALHALPTGSDPVVSVAIEWSTTPTPSDLAAIAAAGGQWQAPPGVATAPTAIQTLRLPLRAVEGVAQLSSVGSVTAAQPLGADPAAEANPPAGFGHRP